MTIGDLMTGYAARDIGARRRINMTHRKERPWEHLRCDRCGAYSPDTQPREDLPGAPDLCDACDQEPRLVYAFGCGCQAAQRGKAWEPFTVCSAHWNADTRAMADALAWRRFVASGPEARIRQGTDRSIT